jgi:hypothetical protein
MTDHDAKRPRSPNEHPQDNKRLKMSDPELDHVEIDRITEDEHAQSTEYIRNILKWPNEEYVLQAHFLPALLLTIAESCKKLKEGCDTLGAAIGYIETHPELVPRLEEAWGKGDFTDIRRMSTPLPSVYIAGI